jgi:protein ImuB
MLWLCISLPQLALEALRSDEGHAPVVVTDCEANARWIIACNETAERAGMKVGMAYATALAIRSDIAMFERKPQAERAALERLAAWAYQFSSTIVIGEAPRELRRARTAALWLEIGASLKLFGGFRKLIEQLEAALAQLQYTYQLGIAPTLEGAALLSRAGIRVALTTTEALQKRIRELSVNRLALPTEVIDKLAMVGIRTIGATLDIPREAIAKRFGVEASNYLDRLIGAAADPRETFKLPPAYTARFEFGFEINGTEALLFPLRRMLREFSGFLTARDTGTQRFKLTFVHRDAEPTELKIGLSMPDRSSDRFFEVVREQLERVALPAPTTELVLSAHEFAAPTALQTDLLHRRLEQHEPLSHTIDRIAARVGEEHVYGLRLAADHRPEASWKKVTSDSSSSPSLRFPDRPLWLLPTPKLLGSSALPVLSGPERIESGWWDDHDVQRDYYVVRTNAGADLWVFKDLRDSQWYLHGFWS